MSRLVTRIAQALGACIFAGALSSSAAAQQQPSPIVDGERIGTPELVKAACEEGQVSYYTIQSDGDERKIVASFMQQFPCIKISIISAVTGRLYERLLNEAAAGKPQSDAVMLSDQALVQKLIEKQLLRKWDPPMTLKYPEGTKLPGFWYAGSGSLMYPIYNTQLVKEADAPKNWNDLLDAKWKDKIATSPPTIGGTAWVQFYFLQKKFGDQYLKRFAAQNPKLFTAYNPVVEGVARGEYPVGVTAGLNEYPLRETQNAPLRAVYPPEGVPYTNYPLFLMANAAHPHAAELFANWYLSKRGQSQLVQVRGAYSARYDVASAKGNPALKDIKVFLPSRARYLGDHEALLNQFSVIFKTR